MCYFVQQNIISTRDLIELLAATVMTVVLQGMTSRVLGISLASDKYSHSGLNGEADALRGLKAVEENPIPTNIVFRIMILFTFL